MSQEVLEEIEQDMYERAVAKHKRSLHRVRSFLLSYPECYVSEHTGKLVCQNEQQEAAQLPSNLDAVDENLKLSLAAMFYIAACEAEDEYPVLHSGDFLLSESKLLRDSFGLEWKRTKRGSGDITVTCNNHFEVLDNLAILADFLWILASNHPPIDVHGRSIYTPRLVNKSIRQSIKRSLQAVN